MAKRVDRENPIQRAIIAYLRAVMIGEPIIAHVANEIGISGPAAARQIAKAKFNGMLPGFPDLIVLPFERVGPMFFEVKAEGNYTTDAQKAVHADMERLGYRVAVVRSIDDVRQYLDLWGVYRKDRGDGL
jgi:hypothetical protein